MRKSRSSKDNNVTIFDIAERVGVAYSTVARALNGNTRISEKTRRLVQDAAAELGYRPSMIAKALSRSRTNTLGVVVPVLEDSVYSAMLKGIERVAGEHGYNVIICCTDAHYETEIKCYESLEQRRVEAILASPLSGDRGPEPYRVLTDLEDRGIPVIVMDMNIPVDNISQVFADDRGGGKRLVQHLISIGHKNIGFVHGGTAANERLVGYKVALEEAGIPYVPELVARITRTDYEADSNYSMEREVESYLKAAGYPSAVVAVEDMLAIKVIRACYSLGVKVPEELAVVGFGDIMVSPHTIPSLTTVHQPAQEMGQIAANLAFQRIDGTLNSHVHQRIVGQVVVRESCGVRVRTRDKVS